MTGVQEFLDDQTKRMLKNSPELDNDTLLTFKDLRYIRMAMIEVSSCWYSIGVQLGIPLNTLDQIRSENRRDSDRCLTLVIGAWLKNSGRCTWRKVIITVSSRVGGDNPALASRIAKDYKNYGSQNAFQGLEKVDGRPLSSDSIRLVVAALAEGVAGKWDSVGIFLGIPYKVIERCRLEDTLEERMTSLASAWVGRKYDVEAYGQPSWRNLVEAVAHKSGGYHKRLATKLANDHPVLFTGITTNPEVMAHPSNPPTSTAAAEMSLLSPPPPTELLSEADLPVLMNLLESMASSWDSLCLQLGVPQSALRNIASQPMRLQGAPKTFLQDGLYAWLQQGSGVCTITALCRALEAPAVGELTLCDHVKAELKSHKGLPS